MDTHLFVFGIHLVKQLLSLSLVALMVGTYKLFLYVTVVELVVVVHDVRILFCPFLFECLYFNTYIHAYIHMYIHTYGMK